MTACSKSVFLRRCLVFKRQSVFCGWLLGCVRKQKELLSNLVFEDCWSCGDLVRVGGFNSVFESNAGDDLGEIIKAA